MYFIKLFRLSPPIFPARTGSAWAQDSLFNLATVFLIFECPMLKRGWIPPKRGALSPAQYEELPR
jgi:hypothetical protein